MKGVDLTPAVAKKLIGAHDTRLNFENVIGLVPVAIDLLITSEMARPTGCAKIALVTLAVNVGIPGLKGTRETVRGGPTARRNRDCHMKLLSWNAAPLPQRGLYGVEHWRGPFAICCQPSRKNVN